MTANVTFAQFNLSRCTCHVLDGNGQFHGNFITSDAAHSWIEDHENAEFGLRVVEGVFTR
jgi:hypothetical protein